MRRVVYRFHGWLCRCEVGDGVARVLSFALRRPGLRFTDGGSSGKRSLLVLM